MNDEEAAIIACPSSVFVMGRSGTGKTLAIVTRLLQVEQRRTELLKAGLQGPRQLVLSMSPKLCLNMSIHIAQVQRTLQRGAAAGAGAEGSPGASSSSGGGGGNGHHSGGHAAASLSTATMYDATDEANAFGALPTDLAAVPDSMLPLVIPYRKLLDILGRTPVAVTPLTEAAAAASSKWEEAPNSDSEGSSSGDDDGGDSGSDSSEDGDGRTVGAAAGYRRGGNRAEAVPDSQKAEVLFTHFVRYVGTFILAVSCGGLCHRLQLMPGNAL